VNGIATSREVLLRFHRAEKRGIGETASFFEAASFFKA
jgi:hypothetical protein